MLPGVNLLQRSLIGLVHIPEELQERVIASKYLCAVELCASSQGGNLRCQHYANRHRFLSTMTFHDMPNHANYHEIAPSVVF